MSDMNINFDLPKDQSNIIKVIGVGGGGSNAVNHMYNQGIKDVDFIICNTDQQALESSPVPVKVQLGTSLTEGLGAGSIADVGRNAAIENIDDVREILSKNTKMVFVTAGMGGGTGTGAAPIIAEAAREMDILTVGIVTVPFGFEGRKRKKQAEQGLEELRKNVDAIIIINNDKLRLLYGNLNLREAFSKADDVLTVAAKGIAETITGNGYMNVDFNDVKTVMTNGGVAIMGTGLAKGEDRAKIAIQNAMSSPLLNDNDITGARHVLLNITYGSNEIQMDEISEITDYLQDIAGDEADVIWGCGYDETLEENISVTLVATGFENENNNPLEIKEVEKKVHVLPEAEPKEITSPSSGFENVAEKDAALEPWKKEVIADEVVEEEVIEEEPQVTLSFDLPKEEPKKEEPIKFILEEEPASNDVQPIIEQTPTEVINTSVSEEPIANTEEVIKHDLTDDYTPDVNEELTLDKEELNAKYQERLNRIKKNTEVLKTPSGINDLENVPAYKRRNIELKDVPHSSENTQSRYTVEQKDENGEKKIELRQNNSFLHDNVD